MIGLGISVTTIRRHRLGIVVTPPVNSPVAGSVTITGTQTEGQILTANTSGLSDADTLGTFAYQWKSDAVNIVGATSSTFTLTATQVGAAITVLVSYTDGAGNAESVLSAATGLIAAAATGPTTLSAYGTDTGTITATITEGVAPDTWDIAFSGGGYDGSTATITETQRLALLPASGGVPLMVVPPLDTEAPVGTHTIRPALWLAPEDDPGVFTSKVYRNGTIEVTTGDGYTYVETASDDGRSLTHRSLASNIAGDGEPFDLTLQEAEVYVPQPVAVSGAQYLVKAADARPDVNSIIYYSSITLTGANLANFAWLFRFGISGETTPMSCNSNFESDKSLISFTGASSQGTSLGNMKPPTTTPNLPVTGDKIIVIWTVCNNTILNGNLGSAAYIFVNGALVWSEKSATNIGADTLKVNLPFGIFCLPMSANKWNNTSASSFAVWTDVSIPDFNNPAEHANFVAADGISTPISWQNAAVGADPVVLFSGGAAGFNGPNQGTWGDIFTRTGTFVDV